MSAHVCLSCSCAITEGQEELRVPGKSGPARYAHAAAADCARALADGPCRRRGGTNPVRYVEGWGNGRQVR